ncbi:hypothetical protein EXIGLDRAFT_765373 [Exidia glandulosa HHB12029]|uniref:Uncharacterized protein n=1 Tax=Exidia glandulosa HHB12029 TaxID=1314781 RepID=A0A165KJ38_EXIGL|nr:hypothetical protein EXIGLDRAFT_765373 [Exidia glandulosa HHB12029]
MYSRLLTLVVVALSALSAAVALPELANRNDNSIPAGGAVARGARSAIPPIEENVEWD